MNKIKLNWKIKNKNQICKNLPNKKISTLDNQIKNKKKFTIKK